MERPDRVSVWPDIYDRFRDTIRLLSAFAQSISDELVTLLR